MNVLVALLVGVVIGACIATIYWLAWMYRAMKP